MRYREHPFTVEFDACVREPGAWKDEVLAAARGVANEARKPLWLCSDGGVRSEVLCRAFFEQGIQIHVFSARTGSRTSTECAAHVARWCRERGIEHHIVDIDTETFLRAGIAEYARAGYLARDIAPYVSLRLLEEVEHLGGYAVIGRMPPSYRLDAKTNELFVPFDSGYFAPQTWCVNNRSEHETAFFARTSELLLAYARHPLIAACIEHPEYLAAPHNADLVRRAVVLAAWPDAEVRRKTTFGEHLSTAVEDAKELLEAEHGPHIETFSLPLKTYVRQLEGGLL